MIQNYASSSNVTFAAYVNIYDIVSTITFMGN